MNKCFEMVPYLFIVFVREKLEALESFADMISKAPLYCSDLS